MNEENRKDCSQLLEEIRGEMKLMRAELEHLRMLNEQRLKSIEKICEETEGIVTIANYIFSRSKKPVRIMRPGCGM